MNIDKKALKGVVDEIEASRARQKAETEFQREALKAAVKNHQLDAKAIRIVLSRRAMGDEKRDEQDYYVHSYEVALGGKKLAMEALEQGATVREAADAGGISTGAAGNLAKVVQKSSFVDKPEDGNDGITGDAHEATDGRRGDARVAEDEPVGALPAADEGCATDPDAGKPEGGEARDGWRSGKVADPTPSVGAVASPKGERVAPQIDDAEAMQAMLNEGAKWKTARASA